MHGLVLARSVIAGRARGAASEDAMPYYSNTELPSAVRSHLPAHAQDTYRETFNHAYTQLAGERDREQRAHMIAWAAVKRSYIKDDGDWVSR